MHLPLLFQLISLLILGAYLSVSIVSDEIVIPSDGIDLGFNRAENTEKALWNIEAGRDSLSIEDSEIEMIAEKYLESGVTIEVVE